MTKSQEHLLAISQRKLISTGVTDVLVERGDQKVVVSAAADSGAHFSEFGYARLVARSETDDELALKVWLRPEIPRDHLLTLFAAASDAVRAKFEAHDRGKAGVVRDMIKQAADRIATQARDRSTAFAAAQACVEALHRAGQLTEERLREFADAGSFDEIAVALSLLCDVPIGAVERALVHVRSDQLLVLARAADLTAQSVGAILATHAGRRVSAQDIEQCIAAYKRLKIETARTAIKFYRLREHVADQVANKRRMSSATIRLKSTVVWIRRIVVRRQAFSGCAL